MNIEFIKQILIRNIYKVLIIIHICFIELIVGEPDLTVVVNKQSGETDYSSFTFRCIGANTSVTSAIYWTDEDEKILIGYSEILPKPDFQVTFGNSNDANNLWEDNGWRVAKSKNVEIPLSHVIWKNYILFANLPSIALDLVGPRILMKQDSFCLSLFYVVCSKCSLIMKIQIDDMETFVSEELLPSTTSGKKWLYKKIFRRNIPVSKSVNLYFQRNLHGEMLEDKQFWAIGAIRSCTESEILVNTIHYESYKPKLKCNTLEENNFKILGSLTFTAYNVNKHCKPGYIGLNCTINCDLFNIPFCQKSIICNKLGCNCSPGFEGSYCAKKCSTGKMGFNCKQRCALGCKNKTCNNVTGICNCKKGFTRNNCTGQLPVLYLPPTIVNSTQSFIYVKQDNLKYKGNMRPKFIHFLYKNKSNDPYDKNEWTDVEGCKVPYLTSLELPIFCNITNLSIFNRYSVKVLLYTEDNETESIAPELNYFTKFYEPQFENITEINTTLEIRRLPKVSSRPLNITIIDQVGSKINLSWYHPNETNAPPKSFEIRIQMDNVTTRNITLTVQSPKKQYYCNITVEPAKTYNVTVFPKNKFLGEPAWIVFDTDPPTPELKNDPYITCKESKCSIVIPEPKIFYSNRTVFLTYTWENESKSILVPEFTIELDKNLLETINPKLLNDTNYMEKIQRSLTVEIKTTIKTKLKRYKVARFTENEEPYDFIALDNASDVYSSLTSHYCTSQTIETTPLLLPQTEVVHIIALENFVQYMKENLNIENYQTVGESTLGTHLQNKFKEVYEILDTNQTDKNVPEDLINNYFFVTEIDRKTYFALEYKTGKAPNFWNMVWKIKITTLVFCVKNFCTEELYAGQIVTDGNAINITVKESKHFDNFFEDIILLTSQDEELQVCVIHFSTDNNILPETLTPLLHYLNNENVPNGSILFADSMGMVLAGILIFCHIAVKRFNNNSNCSFQNILQSFRNKSKYLINEERYIFIHMTVLEYLLCDTFIIPVDINFAKSIRKTLTTDTVRPVMDLLDIILYNGINYTNLLKNKYSRSSRNDQGLIKVKNEPSTNKYSINSVLEIDRQNSFKKFTVVEQPPSNFFEDFWVLIIKKNIKVIVALNDIDIISDEVFFPLKKSIFKFSNNIEVHSKDSFEHNGYSIINSLVTSSNKNVNEVRILLQRNWKKNRNTPKNIAPLLEIINEVTTEKDSHVLVTCHDGMKASGIFISLYNIIEKMNTENQFDVYRTVRDIKRKNINFIKGWDQLEFLYKAALEYSKLKQNLDPSTA